jgi:hypothetical protein
MAKEKASRSIKIILLQVKQIIAGLSLLKFEMKKLPFLIFAFLFSILTKTFGQNYADVQGTWNGTASLVEKLSGQFMTSERSIELTIIDNKVTGTVKYSGDVKIGTVVGHDECFGIGSGELISVNIRTSDGTYDINIEGPECKLVAGGGNSGDGLTGIGISDQKLQLINGQLNTTNLTGTETTTRNVPNMGTFTRTITWHLVSSLDVELIVTPVGYDITGAQKSYDDWLPEPGKDETNKGSYMKIKLKLQSKSGKPLKYKAQSFELRLFNTSIEPGITINYPLIPQPNQLPDLRFIPLAIAESDDQDQSITVTCKNGTTGETFIASYDGGGATTLTADAILEGGIRIRGQLLVSGGDQDIQIPKRVPGAMIATAWLNANGNPKEMDDKESSTDNNYKGDGLTAYEEYRGVISESKYKRLDPKKKEVGIDVIKPELSLFAEGIKWFENATHLTAVIFHEDLNEIGLDRSLNKNFLTNHDYDQFVLRLYKSTIPKRNKQGKYQLIGAGIAGKAYGGPGIPAKVFAVVIDYDANVDAVRHWTDYANQIKMPLPFTLNEYLANTIAHELGHAVSCWHHGISTYSTGGTIEENNKPPVRIFSYLNTEITTRPYEAYGSMKGNQESGDLSCLMAYNPYCKWAYSWDGSTQYFYQVPILPVGKGMCNSGAGTSINKKYTNGNNSFFGDATYGNCLAQIKLRD